MLIHFELIGRIKSEKFSFMNIKKLHRIEIHCLTKPCFRTFSIFHFHTEIDKLKKGANDTFSRHAFMTKYLSFVPKFYVCCHLSPSKYFLPHHNIMHCNAQNFYFTRIFHIAFSRVLEFESEFSVDC